MYHAAILEGVYPTWRASQLSGVPLSTLHYWARTHVVVPSVSPVREKLWSYADLLAVRLVSWLRHNREHGGREYRRSPMPQVRRALNDLAKRRRDLFEVDAAGVRRCVLLARSDGRIAVAEGDAVRETDTRQALLPLDILAEYRVEPGSVGPDLVAPRPHLRILPGKLAGEPHLAGTRVATAVIHGLATAGYPQDRICALYPQAVPAAIAEAIEFERSLAA